MTFDGPSMVQPIEEPALMMTDVKPRPWRSTKKGKLEKPEKSEKPEEEKKEEGKKRDKKKGKAERRRRTQPNPAPQNTWLYSPSMYKRRFCAFFPQTHLCKRSDQCAFAHTREEFRGPLLTVEEETETTHSDEFYMHRYKTMWCPIGVQHDWQSCVYAHNYMDARRDPRIGYGLKQCPHWDKRSSMTGYESRCPQGVACPFAHGAKEQLYHPGYFKTVTCWDAATKSKCPRGGLCAFFHSKADKRETVDPDSFDYTKPLSAEQMQNLQADFRSPPPIGTDEAKPQRTPPTPMYPQMQPQMPMMMVPVFPSGEMDDPSSPQPMMMVPMMMPPPMFGPEQGNGPMSPGPMSPVNGPCMPPGMVMVPMQMQGGMVPMMTHQRQHSGSSGPSPMDQYTQDILNADGETFDLDFEKFASRFSDVSTDDKEDKNELTNSDTD
jgi:hypothetical protein